MQNKISNILSIIFSIAVICLIQSIILLICWNIASVSIFSTISYEIDLVESFFLVIAYKALTYSHTMSEIRGSLFLIEQIKAIELEQKNLQSIRIMQALKKQDDVNE